MIHHPTISNEPAKARFRLSRHKNSSKEQSPVLQLTLPQQVKEILEFHVPERLLLYSSVPTTAQFSDPASTTDTKFFV